ncbi:DUF5994 family protein [Streptomyces sp. NBC_01276]
MAAVSVGVATARSATSVTGARESARETDVLDPLWGRITHAAVNPEHWPVIPHKVKVGWFTPEIDPHKLLLPSYGTGRWDLLVIPPKTGPEAAARLMAAASEYGGTPLTASVLITADRAPHDASMPVCEMRVDKTAASCPCIRPGDESRDAASLSLWLR